MRLYTQSFHYEDSWPIVSLAFLLRYPNPYASHILSCDVISRNVTPQGTLSTTRLILKRGALPKWAQGLINRPESWVIEESEVDPFGRVVRCRTKNLDHVKVMQVQESVELREGNDGIGTVQTTQAQIISRFGWGLAKRIESHGLAKFKANIQRSREGVALVLQMLREARLRSLAVGGAGSGHFAAPFHPVAVHTSDTWVRTYEPSDTKEDQTTAEHSFSGRLGAWSSLKAWFRSSR